MTKLYAQVQYHVFPYPILLQCYVPLEGANLAEADLRFANLRNTDLSSANLQGTNLEFALLDNAILSGANLKCLNHPICKND